MIMLRHINMPFIYLDSKTSSGVATGGHKSPTIQKVICVIYLLNILLVCWRLRLH